MEIIALAILFALIVLVVGFWTGVKWLLILALAIFLIGLITGGSWWRGP